MKVNEKMSKGSIVRLVEDDDTSDNENQTVLNVCNSMRNELNKLTQGQFNI